MMLQNSLDCPSCGGPKLVQKPEFNNTFHLLMCVFTVGLWCLVWGYKRSQHKLEPWRCSSCGTAIQEQTKKQTSIGWGGALVVLLMIVVIGFAAMNPATPPAANHEPVKSQAMQPAETTASESLMATARDTYQAMMRSGLVRGYDSQSQTVFVDEQKWNQNYQGESDALLGVSGLLIGNGKTNVPFRIASSETSATLFQYNGGPLP